MHKLNFLLLAVLFLASCGSETAIPEAIYGNWKGVSWSVEGQDTGLDAAAVSFQFTAPTAYTATFGDQQEKGTFKVDGDKLYTTAEGQMQKMVKIIRLTADTLEMEMNRAGTKENLVLKKE
jgi:hypothetical protein